MKITRLLSIVLLGVTLVAASPAYAQRGGGGRSGGSSSSSHSGGSRSSGSSFSSSRGSSSSSGRSSSSFSSSSRSSSSYSSSPSRSSSSSHSSSSFSSSRSSSTPSFSGSSSYYSGSSSSSGLRSSGSASGSSRSASSSSFSTPATSRTGSVPTQMRNGQSGSRSGAVTGSHDNAVRSNSTGVRTDGGNSRTADAQVGNGRPSGIAPAASGGNHHHPHHNPYYGDPRYHQIYWDPFPPRHYYWPGFWVYCDSYWYDYHVTDIYVVRQYMKETYNMELVAYAISGDYMYALINDRDGHTYLQIYDKNDKLLAEQRVSHKYIKMEVDSQNGGCWIMKKRDKDALLFLYLDGQLLIYEADK